MQALTIKNPWALFIALGLKRIENRDWRPPIGRHLALGDRIAIHAGKAKAKAGEMQEILDELYSLEGGLARNDRFSRLFPTMFGANPVAGLLELQEESAGRVVAIATLSDVHQGIETLPADQVPWFQGEFGWELRGIERVTRRLSASGAPMMGGEVIRGQLGLWNLPAEHKLR